MLDAPDVRVETLAPGPRARAGDGVGRFHDEGFHALFFDFVMMRRDAIDDCVFAAVALDEFGADLGVRAFDIVVDRLADVVQQNRRPWRY